MIYDKIKNSDIDPELKLKLCKKINASRASDLFYKYYYHSGVSRTGGVV